MKDFILKKFNERYTNDSNAKTLSSTLNNFINSIFGEPERIFYELLQNADDAGVSTDVRFNIFLLDDYLVVNYNGKHFDEIDITSLCELYESNKTEDEKKIGYKGIGFKSVFRVSDLVYILSGKEFTFRFDKFHFKNEEYNLNPWQIMPIWTEKQDLPEFFNDIREFIVEDGISILIKIKPELNKEELKNKIKSVYRKYKILLFLRKVKEINFYENNVLLLQSKRTDIGINRKLELTEGKSQKEEQYIASEFEIQVPDDVRKGIAALHDAQCPDKIKNAKFTNITLAITVDKDGNFVIAGNNEIFVYLPTTIKKDFPFIINAEFLTNDKRTELLDKSNSWNDFLFRNLGICLFEWLGQIANSGNKQYLLQLPKLIREEYSVNNSKIWDYSLKKAYNDGLETGMKKVPFLPEQHSGNLVLLKDSVVDKTHYSDNFSDNIDFVKEEITHKYPAIKEPKVINPKLQDLGKLISLGAKEFNITLLCSMLSKPGFKSKLSLQEEKNLIEFLSSTIDQINSISDQNSWNKALSDTDFVLTEENNFRTPKELYFPDPDFDSSLLPTNISLNFVNNALVDALDKTALNWLKKLGILDPNSNEIISRSIGEFLSNGMLNNSNVIEISRYIFENRNTLTSKEYELLKKELKVLTKDNQLIVGWQCYFSDIYQPELCIEQIVSDKIHFVSEDYLSDKADESLIINWYIFFKKLSVQTRMYPMDWAVRLNSGQIQYFPSGKGYYDYLRKEGIGYHFEIENFFKLTLLDAIGNNFDFALKFWEILSTDRDLWNQIQSASRKFKILENNRARKEKTHTYLQYYVRNVNCIPAFETKELFSAAEIYSNRFKDILFGLRPVATIQLFHDAEDHLGLITELSPETILSVLSETAAAGTINEDILKKISLIYEYLSSEWKNYSEEVKSKFSDWSSNNSLLSEANTFEPVKKLYYFDITNFNPPLRSEHFVKFTELSKKNQLQIAQLFSIKSVKEEDLIFSFDNAFSDKDLTNIINNRTAAICFLYSLEYGGNFEERLSLLKNTLTDFNFNSNSYLILKYIDEGEEIYETIVNAWKEGQNVYHTKNWNAPEVLYDLIPILCDIFGLKNLERELQLVLTLDENSLLKWLRNTGADENIINLINHQPKVEVGNNPKPLQTKEVRIKTAAEPETDYDVEEPIIQELINTFPSPENFLPDADEYDLVEIGKRGEKFVYELLLEKHPDKTIIWENETVESKNAYDIKIQGNPDQYIEVKSTVSNYSTGFYISEKEFKMMIGKGKNYLIYRVYNLSSSPAYQILTADDIQFIQFKDGLIAMIGKKIDLKSLE
jgi:hypothetical protein